MIDRNWIMNLSYLLYLLTALHVVFSKTYCPLQCNCTTTTLNCASRSLITTDGIALMKKFEHLDLSNNHLTIIPPIDATFINISSNLIEDIPDFGTNTEIIQLRKNRIKYVSIADCPKSLKHLDLSENPVQEVDLHCNGLLTLDLSNADIGYLPDRFLQGLSSLQILHISHNPLRKIDGDLRSNTLEELRLQNTQLRFIKRSVFSGLTQLKLLDISENKHIHTLDLNSVANVLIARHCSLEDVDLLGMPEVRTVILNHNKIGNLRLPESVRELHASHNLLYALSIDNFTKVDLSNNLLVSLKLHSMDWLNLSSNPISYLKLASMKYLDVSHCRLSTIQSSGAKIHTLNLSHNALEVFSESLNVKILDLSFNRLSSFKVHLESVEEVRLTGNRLVLAEDVISQGRMYLGDNPWTCDCQMSHLYSAAVDINNLTCTHPKNVSGLTWTSACYQNKIPHWMLHHPYIPFLVSIALLIIVMIFFYWLKQKLDTPLPSTENERVVSERGSVRESVTVHDNLPSYEEALLMPGITRKVNVVTQTRSYEVLNSRRLSSNSI